MFYIADGKVYKELANGKVCGCDVSAERNPLTGAITSTTVEEVGSEQEVPEGAFPATINEVIAKFGVAEKPLKFKSTKKWTAKAKADEASAEE